MQSVLEVVHYRISPRHHFHFFLKNIQTILTSAVHKGVAFLVVVMTNLWTLQLIFYILGSLESLAILVVWKHSERIYSVSVG